MDFIDQVKQYAQRVDSLKDSIQTEEATKTALVMPFFSMLGYDVFNPQEFVPEYTADVGIKKGEKVDYAIMQDGQPIILIECKSISEKLDKHDSQLFRYFGTSNAKFAVLTNGLIYKFYTDIENPNKMDATPFLTVNMLDLRDNQVNEIKKFSKTAFDVSSILSTASELKYVHAFKGAFANELESPSDELTKLFLQNIYSGAKTQAVIDRFRPLLKKALADFISEMMNDKIKAALGGTVGSFSIAEPVAPDAPQPELDDAEDGAKAEGKRTPNIVTTVEELEGYFIVKSILSAVADIKDITYKDTESYMGILYKNNTRKWICRLRLNDASKTLILPTEDKKEVKIVLQTIYDINDHKDELIEIVSRYV